MTRLALPGRQKTHELNAHAQPQADLLRRAVWVGGWVQVTFDEFCAALSKWCASKLSTMKPPLTAADTASESALTARLAHEATPLCTGSDMEAGSVASEAGDSDGDEAEEPLTERQGYQQATMKLFLGAVIIALFADPLVRGQPVEVERGGSLGRATLYPVADWTLGTWPQPPAWRQSHPALVHTRED